MPIVDGLQYANWSEKTFREMRAGGVSAVHATICYHESFRATVANIVDWKRRFGTTLLPDAVRRLGSYAALSLVPSSELSRERGAGAGIVDQD